MVGRFGDYTSYARTVIPLRDFELSILQRRCGIFNTSFYSVSKIKSFDMKLENINCSISQCKRILSRGQRMDYPEIMQR